jgi:hypothetical protein
MKQYIESFTTSDEWGHYQDPASDIQNYINDGWTVKSITPIASKYANSSPTTAVLVLFEKEEEPLVKSV